MARKDKVAVKEVAIKGDTISTENHMQVMARLGLHDEHFVFAHGTPQIRVKKSH